MSSPYMFVKEIKVLPYCDKSTLLNQDTCNLSHVMWQSYNPCDLTGEWNLGLAGWTVEKLKCQLDRLNISDSDISFVIS